jgi:hypothetical protein
MSTLLFPICLSGRVTSTNLPRLPLARQLLHPRVVFAAAACEPHRKGRQGEERNGPILLRLFCMQEDTCPEARARTTQRRNERAGRVFSGHPTRSRARYKTAAASGSSPAGFGLAPCPPRRIPWAQRAPSGRMLAALRLFLRCPRSIKRNIRFGAGTLVTTPWPRRAPTT